MSALEASSSRDGADPQHAAESSPLLAGLLDLLGMPLSAGEGEVLEKAVALAMNVTGSPVGFVHLIRDDRGVADVGVCLSWAQGTHAPSGQWRIPVPATGWGIPVRRRSPHVDNDVQGRFVVPGFEGTGERARRYLGVPVVMQGQVEMVLGLANRAAPYSGAEVLVATHVAESAWRVVSRVREHRRTTDELRLLADHSPGPRVVAWLWDPVDASVAWGEGAAGMLGGAAGWSALDDCLDPFSRYALLQARDELEEGQPLDLDLWARDSEGKQRKLRLRGEWTPRAHGGGSVVQGTIADVTAQENAQRALERATRDPLTGLANRAGLIAELHKRLAAGNGREAERFSVHLLDLDRFKEVNDTHGHLVGDAVLRATAARLRHVVRADDMVARLGGDEFVIVQSRCCTRRGIEVLAARILSAVAEPIDVRGVTVSVGTSIGVACSDAAQVSVRDLLAQADEALYRAKRQGLGFHITGDHGRADRRGDDAVEGAGTREPGDGRDEARSAPSL